ncbi:MAG: hypothetical protein PHG02_00385 [Oscillospiraceae bacterium]|nr:hypothetical protein [Oscillospiraceae bacterium]
MSQTASEDFWAGALPQTDFAPFGGTDAFISGAQAPLQSESAGVAPSFAQKNAQSTRKANANTGESTAGGMAANGIMAPQSQATATGVPQGLPKQDALVPQAHRQDSVSDFFAPQNEAALNTAKNHTAHVTASQNSGATEGEALPDGQGGQNPSFTPKTDDTQSLYAALATLGVAGTPSQMAQQLAVFAQQMQASGTNAAQSLMQRQLQEIKAAYPAETATCLSEISGSGAYADYMAKGLGALEAYRLANFDALQAAAQQAAVAAVQQNQLCSPGSIGTAQPAGEKNYATMSDEEFDYYLKLGMQGRL